MPPNTRRINIGGFPYCIPKNYIYGYVILDSPEIKKLLPSNEKRCDLLICLADPQRKIIFWFFIEEKSRDIRTAVEQIEQCVKRKDILKKYIQWEDPSFFHHDCSKKYKDVHVRYLHHHARKIDKKIMAMVVRKRKFIFMGTLIRDFLLSRKRTNFREGTNISFFPTVFGHDLPC